MKTALKSFQLVALTLLVSFALTSISLFISCERHAEAATLKRLTASTTTAATTTTATTTTTTTTSNVNVTSYGAKGDGVTNDTAAIQAAINAIPATGGTVVIPAGTYMIDAVKSINLKSNVTLQMSPTTTLKAISNSSTSYALLNLYNVSNVIITGGVLLGDRTSHIGTTGEWGMGIQIMGSTGVSVTGTTAKNCWGDGFYIGSVGSKVSQNITLTDIVSDNNRRQGLSIVSGVNLQIVRPKLTNTNGTAPSDGIDIEPNAITDILQNVVITSPYTANNKGDGIGIDLAKLKGTSAPVSISILSHQDTGSYMGMEIYNTWDVILPGTLLIDKPIWTNSRYNALAIENLNNLSYKLTINQPTVINCNTNANPYGNFGSAYCSLNWPVQTLAGATKNVQIVGAAVTDSRSPQLTRGNFFTNGDNTAITYR
ncbi:MAG: glycosyl hydrolase family 28-related protein [Negativicutes bacterium]|nr:glycosyl hydrolase family 28-related protein [Negativicutes bacterium]